MNKVMTVVGITLIGYGVKGLVESTQEFLEEQKAMREKIREAREESARILFNGIRESLLADAKEKRELKMELIDNLRFINKTILANNKVAREELPAERLAVIEANEKRIEELNKELQR